MERRKITPLSEEELKEQEEKREKDRRVAHSLLGFDSLNIDKSLIRAFGIGEASFLLVLFKEIEEVDDAKWEAEDGWFTPAQTNFEERVGVTTNQLKEIVKRLTDMSVLGVRETEDTLWINVNHDELKNRVEASFFM